MKDRVRMSSRTKACETEKESTKAKTVFSMNENGIWKISVVNKINVVA